MSDKVDALFDGEPPPTPRSAASKLRSIRHALLIALPLDVMGVLCWTGVPGAAITLWAWLQADGEMERIEKGEYSSDDAALLIQARRQASLLLAFCLLSLIFQAYLLTTSFYTELWSML